MTAVMHLPPFQRSDGGIDAAATYAINREPPSGWPARLEGGACPLSFRRKRSFTVRQKLDLDETDPLNPLTAYARSKIETEQPVSALADRDFTPPPRQRDGLRHSPNAAQRSRVNIFWRARGEAKFASCRMVTVAPLIHAATSPGVRAFMNAPKEKSTRP